MKTDDGQKGETTAENMIKQSATYVRLRRLVFRFLFFLVVCSVAALPFILSRSVLCAIVAALLLAAGLTCLYFAVYFFVLWQKLKNEAPMYLITETKSASFECFGAYLALNVTFCDGEGMLREGRSRFLFSPHDVEAWQNVPLKIGYKPQSEQIVIIGADL